MKQLSKDGQNRRSSFLFQVLASLIFLGGLALYYVSFGTNGMLRYTLATTKPSLLWLAGSLLKYLLLILVVASFIWFFSLFTHKVLRVANSLRMWMIVWLGGMVTLAIMLAWSNYHLWTMMVYGQVFFLTRNLFPFLSGIVIFSFLQPWLKKHLHSANLRHFLLLLLCLPLIFNHDIFNVGSGMSIVGMLILGGAALAVSDSDVHLSLKTLWLIVIGYAATVIMGVIESQGGLTLGNATRFVGPMSPLTLIPAMTLVQIVQRRSVKVDHLTARQKHFDESLRWGTVFTALMLAGFGYSNAASAQYKWMGSLLSALGPANVISPAILFSLLGIAAGVIAYGVAVRMPFWQGVMVHWNLPASKAWTYLEGNWKPLLKNWLHKHQRAFIAFGVLFIAQCISALLMNQSLKTVENIYDPNLNIFVFSIMVNFGRMLLGTVILLAAYWVLLSLTNRYWTSLILVSAFTLIFAVANLVKIQLRSIPIIASDMVELKSSIPELAKMVSPTLLIGAGIVIILVIALIVVIETHAKSAAQSWPVRVFKFVVASVFIFSLGQLNHTYSYTRNVMMALNVSMENNNQLRYAQWYGPVMQYISGLDVNPMTAPKGYSKQAIANLVKKYKKEAASINKTRPNKLSKQTIIYNLSESYADPRRVATLNKNPMPYVDSMKQANTSGYMMSFGYGGGTADMEYMTLTGMSLGNFDTTLNTPYTQLVPKLKVAPNIGHDLPYAQTVHPYTGNFYNRPAVYKKFGFNRFTYLGSKYKIYDQKILGKSPYLSDETAYKNAVIHINNHKGGQFMILITIQNHMPYNGWYKNNPYVLKSNDVILQSKKMQIETYADGVHYTDGAVKQFKEAIDKIDKPIVWVFYGDHLPGIYGNMSDVILQHKTDYFIYANKYAREHGAKTKLTKTKYVGPSDFTALALEQAGAKVNPYNALLTKVQHVIPAEWLKTDNSREDSTVGVRLISQKGKSLPYKKLTAKQKSVMHDYQLLQYDITAGKQYSLKLGMGQ